MRHPVASFVLGSCAVVGAAILVSRIRFARRLTAEMGKLLVATPSTRPPVVSDLPAPVERYRRLAVASDRGQVRTLRLRHGGTFQMSPTARVSPIRGTQLFTSDPPGFVWTGRVRMLPGLWIDARDMLVAGKGSMRVLLDDVVPLADAEGEYIDQGSSLRLLAELVWYPTALFDGRNVTWTAIDAEHARATLGTGRQAVSGVFAFGLDGMPVGFAAERFTDAGELRPWGGTYRDWRTVSGMRVPFEADVTWQLESGPFTYAHWLVESMEYDVEPV